MDTPNTLPPCATCGVPMRHAALCASDPTPPRCAGCQHALSHGTCPVCQPTRFTEVCTPSIVLLDSVTTLEISGGERVTSKHLSERLARVHYARQRLHLAGWVVTPPGSGEGYRLPLNYPDERMKQPLDGARPRACGFTARKADEYVRLDASGDLTPVFFHVGEARETFALLDVTLDAMGATRQLVASGAL